MEEDALPPASQAPRKRANGRLLAARKRLKTQEEGDPGRPSEDVEESRLPLHRRGREGCSQQPNARRLLQLLEEKDEPPQAFPAPVEVLVTKALTAVQGVRCFEGTVLGAEGQPPRETNCSFVLGSEVETAQALEEGDVVRVDRVWLLDEELRTWFVASLLEQLLE